ncbi:MFS transporter [Tumebacillus sp. ITR2]|uniref:MFS transporter n=1 Tax=Tumebacillus amylolyticus TaxID=2801339 RepID=A0ABS1J8M0_9BACL|nr:MDR family MFS transporter [Tumebacillus amylolyticus]MBL0386550.1 MFS transporter [Tumebacillus amylolyticus]
MTQKGNRFGLIMVGLMLGILMAAMDNTIVATAMGTIVSDLGGLDKIVWVTSAYMVAEMAGMPIFGKLSDMYGRKRFFMFGLIVFLLGSILCGTATSLVQLSIYRAIQGIGGGALMPIAFTIIFDVIPMESRGKIGGLFGAVFGMSSIFGPLLGAWITESFGWHWCFYINLPLGLIAVILIGVFYKESIEHARQKIDWAGAITLVGSVVCLMFALELGGNKYEWNSAPIWSLFAGFAVLLVAFLIAERRAEEPILPFALFRRRLFAASTAVGFFYGISMIVATVYIPIFIQGVQGGTATNSGLILLPLMLGSVFAAQIGGMSAQKVKYRNIMIVSAVILLVGTYLLGTLTADTSKLMVTLYMIVIGVGIGFSFSVVGMASIQGMEDWERGTASSTSSFVRSFGMTIGVTIYGILQRNVFTKDLQDAFAGTGGSGEPSSFANMDPRALLSPDGRAQIPAPILSKITDALSSSIAHTFVWALIPAVLAFVFVLMMGNDRMIVPEKVKVAKKAL